MKFIYRAMLLGLVIVLVLIYFVHMKSDPTEESLLEYISDRFGENCTYKGVVYREGELFTEPCKQCYCSFGEIECAVVHCKNTENTLGMDVIQRAVQILVPTDADNFAGTIALMNSVVKHTTRHVKFTLYLRIKSDIDRNHLSKWIEGTALRFVDYVIIEHDSEWISKSQIFPRLSDKKEDEHPLQGALKDENIQNNPWATLLLLSSLLAMEHRVIVLSSNVLVRGDVGELFNLDMQGNSLAVVDSCRSGEGLRYQDYIGDFLLHLYNVSGSECVFSPNAMLVDLDSWFDGETQFKLLRTLGSVMVKKDNLPKKNSALFAPLFFYFHNRYLDLSQIWNVSHISADTNPESLSNAKILSWGDDQPWTSHLHDIWDNYFLNDPTGLFRLKYKVEL